jgi:hypothetical protein
LRCVLPYPDVLRRVRVRRAAFRLVTSQPWPGDDATGEDAAQLALLRILSLQRDTRRAVRSRRHEAAALQARVALETYILGVFCLHAEDGVSKLVAADNRALRKLLAYLADNDLVSLAAINDSADAVGRPGPDFNARAAAQWLATERSMGLPLSLYERYYVPLSHFYAHPSGFALMRHVGPGGKLRRRPARAWARRSPARLADACAGFMAAAVAEEIGSDGGRFAKYAEAHIDRTLTPAGSVAGRGLREAVDWRKLPETLRIIAELRRYTHGPAVDDDPDEREARIRSGFEKAFGLLRLDLPDAAFQSPIDLFVSKVLSSFEEPGARPAGEGGQGNPEGDLPPE